MIFKYSFGYFRKSILHVFMKIIFTYHVFPCWYSPPYRLPSSYTFRLIWFSIHNLKRTMLWKMGVERVLDRVDKSVDAIAWVYFSLVIFIYERSDSVWKEKKKLQNCAIFIHKYPTVPSAMSFNIIAMVFFWNGEWKNMSIIIYELNLHSRREVSPTRSITRSRIEETIWFDYVWEEVLEKYHAYSNT